jgi:hypothetical protein
MEHAEYLIKIVNNQLFVVLTVINKSNTLNFTIPLKADVNLKYFPTVLSSDAVLRQAMRISVHWKKPGRK